MKKFIKKIKDLSTKKKIQMATAVFLTLCLLISLPVFAWFTDQKRAAELFKIQYPNSLYINAAHREDRIYFNLDELDLDEYITDENNKPVNFNTDPEGTPEYRKQTHKLYAFSVSGEGTTSFTLQLAHTNNNMLEYEIYEATQTNTKPASGIENYDWVHYERHTGNGDNSENPFVFSDDLTVKDAYYISGTEISGEFKNPDTQDENHILAKKDISDKYYKKTYGNSNTNVQIQAVPSYWQTNISLSRNDINPNTKRFHKYYILKVKWKEQQTNTKETDMIYLAVKRTG